MLMIREPLPVSGDSATKPRGFGQSLARDRVRVALIIAFIWVSSVALFSAPFFLSVDEAFDPRAIFAHVGIGIFGILGSILLMVGMIPLIARDSRAAFAGIVALVVLVTALMSALDIYIFDIASELFGAETRPAGEGAPPVVRWAANFAIYMTQFTAIAAIVWVFETLARHRASERELETIRLAASEAEGRAQAARLQALRYQLNPHFLFNTLNSISSLVMSRRNREGEAMIEQLSGFLRKTLVAEPSAVQTLEQELETVDAYLAIERIRFGDRLAIEVDCPPRLRDAEVPPFLLQPLVENAIKYGVSSTDRPVTIQIEAVADGDDLVITVEDDGEGGEAPPQGGTGIGLRNVRERLAAVYGERGRLEALRREKGYLAVVRLPLSLDAAR